ncbi:putative 2-dehydropantoate 2-reductase [Geotalea sp. SG265]|uniref:putative 2-dehydropantoate 2-reductase n=1 Tax=Geotalea sp. SG265 TaxID=2922867 RepID=UPI001FAEDCA0
MRIAVVGAGALGLYYGAMLQKGGNDVRFLLRRDLEAIRKKGLSVFSINGNFRLFPVAGYGSSQEIGSVDLVLVGLKTFANHSYRELITPLLRDDSIILTLQNGLGNEDALAEIFGGDRVMGGVAFLCSNRGEPGVVHHLGAGRIILGEHSRREMERAEMVANLFSDAGVPCCAVADLKKARWEKLVWNIPFNGTCALLQKPVNVLLSHPRTRQSLREIMVELIKAANSQGLSSPISLDYAEEMLEFTDAMGAYKPSMQIDREEGRELELDAIFAQPLAAARRKGVAMPRVDQLHAFLEEATRTA